MRIHSIVLIGLIALVGCSAPPATSSPTTEPPPPETAIPATDAAPEIVKPPKFYLLDESGVPFPGIQGSYCWNGDAGAGMCVDYMFPANPASRMQHTASAPIEIKFDEPAPDTASMTIYGSTPDDLKGSGEIALTDGEGSFTLDQPPGDYLVQVSAYWADRGDNTVFFAVTVH